MQSIIMRESSMQQIIIYYLNLKKKIKENIFLFIMSYNTVIDKGEENFYNNKLELFLLLKDNKLQMHL